MRWLVIAAFFAVLTVQRAQADPVTGSVVAFGSFLAANAGAALQVGGILASVGLSLLARRRGPKIAAQTQTRSDVVKREEAEGIEAVGRARVPTVSVFSAADDYENCEVYVAGFTSTIPEEHYLGGRMVVVDPGGLVSTPPYGVLLSPDSFAAVRFTSADEATIADAELVQRFPGVWTEDHRGRGLTYVVCRFRSPGFSDPQYSRIYPNGFPSYEVLGRWGDYFDPRINQRTWSENAVLIAAEMLVRAGIESTAIDWIDLISEANKADELVSTKTGSAPRARLGGYYETLSDRGKPISDALRSSGLRIVYEPQTDGTILYKICLIEDQPSPDLTVPSKLYTRLAWSSGPSTHDRPNVCRLKCICPTRDYKLSEIDLSEVAWSRVESDIDKHGEREFVVELPLCNDVSQAQRIARRLFAQERAETLTVEFDGAGLMLWGAVYVQMDLSDVGGAESELLQILDGRYDPSSNMTSVTMRVVPQLDEWSPATDEADPPAEIEDIPASTAVEKAATPTSYYINTAASPAVTRLAYAWPTGAVAAEARYRVWDGNLPREWARMEEYRDANTGFIFAEAPIDPTNLRIDFEVVGVGNEQAHGSPSDHFTVIGALEAVAPQTPTVVIALIDDTGPNLKLQVTVTDPGSLSISGMTITNIGSYDPAWTPGERRSFELDVSPLAEAYDFVVTAQSYDARSTLSGVASASYPIPAQPA